jgi:predicted HicB family RNase H-like nuclease
MKKMESYKGYTATVVFDPDDMVLHGRVDNLRDLITFRAPAIEDLQKEFESAIDEYLEYCAARGKEPDRPYSGRFVLRLEPALHRKVAIAADRQEVSINTWIVNAINTALDESLDPHPRESALVERVASLVHAQLEQRMRVRKRA